MDGNERDRGTARSIEHWESALRVRCAVIAQQLTELTLAGRQLPGGAWSAPTFASASHVSEYVTNAVGTISAAYHTGRKHLTENEALRAVIDADCAIDEIGRDPVVVEFLLWGIHAELERLRSVCRLLAVLLDVQPDAAPSPRAAARTAR